MPLGFAVALSAAMLVVVVLDATRYIIPNTLNGGIILLFALGCFLLPLHPLPSLGAAAIMLILGLGLFALGLMGGGDIKLLVALTLWTGWNIASLQFIFATAIFGGVLVLMVLPARKLLPSLWTNKGKTPPRLLRRGEPVPYGIAIAAAFLWIVWRGMVPGLNHLLG